MNWCRILLRFAILAIWGVSYGPVSAQQTAPKPSAEKPIAALDWLVGGMWVADATKMGSGMQRIETNYQWSDNNAFLRFTTHFVSDKGAARVYDGNLFWDGNKNSYWIWYLDSRNSITEGPTQWDGHTLTISFRGLDFEGKMADLRVDVTRSGSDSYHWALFEKQADAWKELAGLDYHRSPSK